MRPFSPLLTGGLATALLVAMALPAFGLHTGLPGATGLPKDMPIVRTYDRIQAAFPGGPMPASVVVSAKGIVDETATKTARAAR